LAAQTAANVLVVVNKQSAVSQRIGAYYVKHREIPLAQVCTIDTHEADEIERDVYNREIEAPIDRFLHANRLADKIWYIVTTLGVPLRIKGIGEGTQTEIAAVDSELAALYARDHGITVVLRGAAGNPYFKQTETPFGHPRIPIYMVTRLAGYDFEDVRTIIDRSLAAKNEGMWVLDARADNNTPGNEWLRLAAARLPKERVILENSGDVVYDKKNVIGYASWGSNDPDRHKRHLGFDWLPGAVATEYVSTNARTFSRPPDSWNIGTWKNPLGWFYGSPQTMTADLIHEGATLATGHVAEPYLELNPRPDILLPAYAGGRNFAESFYLSIPAISWQNVAIGDPLCRLK
jgi:uncharacterized protein (TIGR03790 family)